MKARDANGPCTSLSHDSEHGSVVSLVAHSDEGPGFEIEGGENCRTLATNVLSDGLFGGDDFVSVINLDQHVDRNQLPTLLSLLVDHDFGELLNRILMRGPQLALQLSLGNLVSPRRILLVTLWR